MPGKLSFDLTANGKQVSDGQEIQFSLENLKGQFREYPVSGNIRISKHANDIIDFHKSTLKLNQAYLEIEGKLAQQWNLNWLISIPDLYEISPQMSGTINTSGHLAGTPDAPTLIANLEGKTLSIGDHSHLDNIKGKFNIDLHPDGNTQVELMGKSLIWQGRQFKKIHLSATGPTKHQKIMFEGNGPHDSFKMAFQGGWSSSYWQGDLTDVVFKLQNMDSWHLEKPAPLKLGYHQATLDKLCLDTKKKFGLF